MIYKRRFQYAPSESEKEKAANSYLMSLLATFLGGPLPIMNLLATIIFYFGVRDDSLKFAKWHATQALLSQFALFFMNSVFFVWALRVFFGSASISNYFIAYLIMAFLVNFGEMVATIYTTIQVRKGHHIVWHFYGPLTDSVFKS